MKKISFLCACLLIVLSLISPCVADEATTELVTEVTDEVVTEALTEDEVVIPDSMSEEDVEQYWESFKATITDSATWTMIGTALITILSLLATVKSGVNKFKALVGTKADNETVQASIKETKEELIKSFDEAYEGFSSTLKRYEEALKNTDENEQKMYAIFTLFMTNCKISESAKAEILGILANVKKYEGNTAEMVAQAQEAIDREIKEKENAAPPTPTLDKLLEEDYMELG